MSRAGRYVLRTRSNANAAGTTNSDNSGAVTMPPSMGAAMRLMTSAPVPLAQTMGSRPASSVATVMALARTRSTAPSRMASCTTASVGAGESDPRLTVRAIFELPTTQLLADTVKSYNAVKGGATVDINLDGKGAVKLALVEDTALKPGDEVTGPALVRGSYLTCVVAADWRLRVSSNGDLFVESK